MNSLLRAFVAGLAIVALAPAASAGDKAKGKASMTDGSGAAAAPSVASLSQEVEDALSEADTYRQEGFSPQEIQAVKDLLQLRYPDTDDGASLKARVYVELSRIYAAQDISPMAIKLLQDGVADLTGHVDAEIALRQELVALYRSLGFAPQAIREHKRIRELRRRTS